MGDTTKKNMGRRKNHECSACPRRVAKAGDEYCPHCLSLKDRPKLWRHRVMKAR